MPTDFDVFKFPEKHLTGKRFETDADVKQGVTSLLETFETDFFYVGMQALLPQ